MTKHKSILRTLIIVFVFLLLSGCSTNIEITFFKNGTWKLENNSSYPDVATGITGGVLSLLGSSQGEISLFDGLAKSLYAGSINLAKNEFRQHGLEMNWEQKKKEGNIVESVVISGDSFDKFNTFLSISEMGTVIPIGENTYRLEMGLDQPDELYSMLGMEELIPYMELLSGMADNEVRINTSKVLSSNAHKIEGGTAIWYNPNFVFIEFEPKGQFSLGGNQNLFIILIIVLAAIFMTVIGISIYNKKRNHKHRRLRSWQRY